jgi:hypothetical protein
MTIRIADLRALAEGFDPTLSKSWSLPARAYTRLEFQEADQEEAQDYWLANQIDGDPLAPLQRELETWIWILRRTQSEH